MAPPQRKGEPAMIAATTEVRTEKASRYLQQLCKHFAHKVEAEFTETEGVARLPGGETRMQADDQTLRIRIESEDEAGLARAQHIVEDHLIRFAFREQLGPCDWRREA